VNWDWGLGISDCGFNKVSEEILDCGLFKMPMSDNHDTLCAGAPAAGWHVYIMLCRDGTFYTGITLDPARRLAEHNSATGGAKYTRPRRPVTLVYVETAASRSAAARREYQLRKLPPAKKKLLMDIWLTADA
jgi:putative endonuclease